MEADGHLETGKQLEQSAKILSHNPETHVKAIVELVFGAAHHYAAFGLQTRYGEHSDKHNQILGLLRKHGDLDISASFEAIDSLRAGRFYGRRGNGDAAEQCMEYLLVIKQWCTQS